MAVQTITYGDKSYLNELPDIPATNKVQDVDMNEIKSVVNNNATELLNLQPVTLFNNSAGTNSVVNLSDSLENYSYIEIFFTDNNKTTIDSKKAINPNGYILDYEMVGTGVSHNVFHRICNYELNGTTITPTYFYYYVITSTGTITGVEYNINYIYITRVNGYK